MDSHGWIFLQKPLKFCKSIHPRSLILTDGFSPIKQENKKNSILENPSARMEFFIPKGLNKNKHLANRKTIDNPDGTNKEPPKKVPRWIHPRSKLK
jgi:hypothetical protein